MIWESIPLITVPRTLWELEVGYISRGTIFINHVSNGEMDP